MSTPGDRPRADDAAWAPSARHHRAESPVELLAGYTGFTVVARGGDSVVYRAHQDGIDRDVAIKVVQLDDAETIARFERELAITVRLGRQHPHIVTVLATGTTVEGQPCLVMDFYELGSLQDRLAERGPLPVSEVVQAGSVVADALSFAHAQGVLHRDVKPQNILSLPTSYVLADFGLARAIDAGHTSSLERFSYRHASPQVLDGEAPSTADDIYSLGSTLFTLLDGRPPFATDDPDEDSALSYLRRARTDEPRPLTRDDIPPQLVAVVMRCLSRQRADRFPDANRLRAALDAVPTESRNWAPDADAPAPPPPVRPVLGADTAFAPSDPTPVQPAPSEPAPSEPARSEPAPPEPASSEPASSEPAPSSAAPTPAALEPAPPVAESEPVAVSALAHLGAGQPGPAHPTADIDATGLRPAEPPPPPPEVAKPRRWPLLVAVLVVAAVVGVVLGIRHNGGTNPAAGHHPSTSHPVSPAGTGTDSSPSTAPGSSSAPAALPVSSGTLPSGTTASVVPDQAIAPKITKVTRVGTDVVIEFTDPVAKNAQVSFVIYRVDTKTPYYPQPGARSATLNAQPIGKRCYTVTAFVPKNGDFGKGTSTESCTAS